MSDKSRKAECAAKQQIWKTHLAQWQSCPLNQAEYCKENDLKQYQFSYWKRKLATSQQQVPSFLPVKILESPIEQPLEMTAQLQLEMCSGYRIHIGNQFSRETLCRLLSALEANQC